MFDYEKTDLFLLRAEEISNTKTTDDAFEIITKEKHYIGNGDKVIYSPQKEEYTILGNGYLQEKNDDRKVYGDTIFVNQLTGEARVKGSEQKPVRFIINIERGEDKGKNNENN